MINRFVYTPKLPYIQSKSRFPLPEFSKYHYFVKFISLSINVLIFHIVKNFMFCFVIWSMDSSRGAKGVYRGVGQGGQCPPYTCKGGGA